MKIQVLTSVGAVFEGRAYSYGPGERDVKKEIAEDLIKCGHARAIEEKKRATKSNAKNKKSQAFNPFGFGKKSN